MWGVGCVGVYLARLKAVFKPLLQKAQSVALLHLAHKLLNRCHGSHRDNELLDVVLVACHVQQRADHLGGLHGLLLLDEDVDVRKVLGVVEEAHHLVDHVVLVADVDERPEVLQTLLLEEVLCLLGGVEVALACHALDLLKLADVRRRLDEAVVHLRLLHASIALCVRADDCPQEVVQRVETAVLQEEVDQLLAAKEVVVLDCSLHADLVVVVLVVRHELADERKGVLLGELLEEVHKPLMPDDVGVDNNTLHVRQGGLSVLRVLLDLVVVLKRALEELCALAELGDLESLVVGELEAFEDLVGNLRGGVHKVDLEEACLQGTELLLVLLEHLQEVCCGRADRVLGDEHLEDAVVVEGRLDVFLVQRLRQVRCAFGVPHVADLVQQLRPVHAELLLALDVLNDLLPLLLLDKHHNNLPVCLPLEVDLQGQTRLVLLHKVSQLFALLKLLLLDVLLHDLNAVGLGEHHLNELDALENVELGVLDHEFEVQSLGGLGADSNGHGLELFEHLLGPEHLVGCFRAESDGGLDLLRLQEGVEAVHVEVVSTTKVCARGNAHGEGLVPEALCHPLHDGLLVDVHQTHLSLRVHGEHSAGALVLCRHEHRGVLGRPANLLLVDHRPALHVHQVAPPTPAEDVQNAHLVVCVHADGEVALLVERDLRSHLLEFS